MSSTVLVITNEEDLHASAVIAHLNAMGTIDFRFNTEKLLTEQTFSLQQSADGESLLISDQASGRSLQGQDIGVVYFRRPAPPEVPSLWGDNPQAAEVVASESRWFLRWLYAYFHDRPWFSANPSVIDHASCKPLQMRLARSLGFRVPDTYYGNNAYDILSMSSASPLVVKAIRETGFEANEVFHAFYTAEVDRVQLQESPEQLVASLNFLQQKFEKDHELRVTWVDGHCYAARIHSQTGPETAKLDWRRVNWQELDYSVAQLPDQLVQQMGAYCQAFGLNYGAFDFIVTKDGEYIFLECNSNGQWLWIDEKLQIGIAHGIATALQKRTR